MSEEHKQPQPQEAPAAATGPEGPQPQGKTPEPTAPQPETDAARPEAPKPREASPWRRRFRRFLWFVALTVVVFLCGFLTAVVTLVQPRDQRIFQLQEKAQTLSLRVEDLERQLQEKEDRIRSLEEQLGETEQRLADLKDEHLRLMQELALVRAQRSLYKAIAALEARDTRGARLALEAAREDLSFLHDHANERLKPLVADLQEALDDLQPQLTPTDKTVAQLKRLAENLEDLQDLLGK